MSTRTSLAFSVFQQEPLKLHVYKELMDGLFYITDEKSTVQLPNKEIADKIAAIIKGYEVDK